MEIAFPVGKLLENGLTADDFTICTLLDNENFGLLKEFLKVKGMSFYDNLSNLKNKGYVEYNVIGNIVPIKEIKVTDDFRKLIAFEDPFLELYNTYPVRAIRPDGKQDYLRRDKNKCRLRYTKLIKKNPLLHKHIINCLKYEKKHKQNNGSLGYFKRLYNWIESKEWEKYEDKLHNITNDYIPQNNNNNKSVAYGTEIL